VVEHYLHTVGVAGSKPAARTTFSWILRASQNLHEMNEINAGKVQKSQGGGKTISIITVLLVAAALVGLLFAVMPPKEPSYDGRSLSYWLAHFKGEDAQNSATNNPADLECRKAVQHIGTNAIPFLLRIIRAKDSAVKVKLMDLAERQNFINIPISSVDEQKYKAVTGFFLLGDLATNAIPALVDICTNSPSVASKEAAEEVLMMTYPVSDSALPYWVQPARRADWCLSAGTTKLQWGAYTNALSAFSAAIELNPTNARAYLNRAVTKMQLKDFKGAVSDIGTALEFDGSNQPAFYSRGLCKFALKDFKSADADFTTAIDLETNDFNAYNYRGLARANLRKLDDALADFNQAVALSPQEAISYRNRALVERLQKEYELALADLTKSIYLDDKDAQAYLLRGLVKNALKDYPSALLDCNHAVELNPGNPTAYTVRGDAKMDMDDFDGASADLDKALQLDPTAVAAYLIRGCLKGKRGDEDDATLADLEHAVELAPQLPESHGTLGLFQYRFSQWVPALENCRKALEMGALGGTTDLRSYIWLIRAQTGEEADANRELETYLESLPATKTNEWDASVARFLSGSLMESNFLGQATTTAKRPSAVRGQVCESFYYAGMKRKLAGDKQGAREFFQKCLDTKDDNNFGYLNAGVEMRALANK
jgi:tetratricopeptide (TPR) repeat protein